MTEGHLYTAANGIRGFDLNQPVTRAWAKQRRARGDLFVLRYVRRVQRHRYDLSVGEVETILAAGLGLAIVQHVAPPGWVPTQALGEQYGETAADEVAALGLPPGVMVACDLEGVKRGTPAAQVIDFCNEWHLRVAAAGYTPMLYVGYDPGLTASQLYYKLRFTRYWSALNLNRDLYPAVRGVQLRQLEESKYIDADVVQTDKLGSRPIFLAREGWAGARRASGVRRAARKRAKAGRG